MLLKGTALEGMTRVKKIRNAERRRAVLEEPPVETDSIERCWVCLDILTE